MTVWVTNPVPNQDISSAETYGHIEYVNHRYVFPDELEDDRSLPFWFRRALGDVADGFDPRHDYLLLVGDHLQWVEFVGLVLRQNPYLNVLRWDKQLQEYIVVKIGG